jgi:hypothetical protein
LQKLIALVQPEVFKAKTLCALNPKFGRASELVGGADCDLVIDEALIDIKTTKNFQLERGHLDQVIGYYVLSKIGGIQGAPKGHQINQVGIYFSRFGHLWLFNVHDVVKVERWPEFINWFKQRARAASTEEPENKS